MHKRILLAEDDPAIVKVTRLRLEYAGFEVVTAQNGEEAWRQAVNDPTLDLVLMDIKMPKLNGFEVCQRLKADPRTASIPIIIMTATTIYLQDLANRCIELGASDWVRKPFRSEELLQKIHRVLAEEGPTYG